LLLLRVFLLPSNLLVTYTGRIGRTIANQKNKRCCMFPWLELSVQLIATFVGATLGVASAIWLDRHEEKRTKQQRTLRMIAALLEQLEATAASLSIVSNQIAAQAEGPGALALEFNVPLLSTSSFETAAYSGDLALFDPTLQTSLGRFDESIRIVKVYLDHVLISAAELDAPKVQALNNAFLHLKSACEIPLNLKDEVRRGLHAELEKLPRSFKRGSVGNMNSVDR
jgi:hypothetical protein